MRVQIKLKIRFSSSIFNLFYIFSAVLDVYSFLRYSVQPAALEIVD